MLPTILLAAFIGSLEFYVIAFAVAVALIVLMMRPNDKGAAQTFFARGVISDDDGDKGLEITTDTNGCLEWTRHCVAVDSADCQINCAVTVIDHDIKIIEKRVVDRLAAMEPHTCTVKFPTFEPLRPGRYHIRYEAEWSGEWASGYLRVPASIAKRMEMHL